MQKILNIRKRLYYKRQKLDNESEKEVVTKEIIGVTSVLQEVVKEIRLCNEFYDDVPKMKEQIKEIDEKNQVKKLKEEKRWKV